MPPAKGTETSAASGISKVRYRRQREAPCRNPGRGSTFWCFDPRGHWKSRRRNSRTGRRCLDGLGWGRRIEEMQVIWIAVVAVLALVLGLASSIVVRRRAANPEQAVRNWRVFNGCCMLLAAVVLFFIGITE